MYLILTTQQYDSRVAYCFFFFKQKTAYEMRISDWSSDVCSSDLDGSIASDPLVPNASDVDWRDLPPSEWSKIDDILDYEGDKECRARSIARKRLSARDRKRVV